MKIKFLAVLAAILLNTAPLIITNSADDFSYEDLDNFHAADYICEKLKEEKYENEDLYVIECKKKSPDSQYSKFIILFLA